MNDEQQDRYWREKQEKLDWNVLILLILVFAAAVLFVPWVFKRWDQFMAASPGREPECRTTCQALQGRMVSVTRYGCVCELPAGLDGEPYAVVLEER